MEREEGKEMEVVKKKAHKEERQLWRRKQKYSFSAMFNRQCTFTVSHFNL